MHCYAGACSNPTDAPPTATVIATISQAGFASPQALLVSQPVQQKAISKPSQQPLQRSRQPTQTQKPPQQQREQPARRAAPQQQQQQPQQRLRAALAALSDPARPVALPPAELLAEAPLNNRELDKLVANLGRGRATWRRALVLFEWLKEAGHELDDRLCTTVSQAAGRQGREKGILARSEQQRR
jgi:hypothetical protein